LSAKNADRAAAQTVLEMISRTVLDHVQMKLVVIDFLEFGETFVSEKHVTLFDWMHSGFLPAIIAGTGVVSRIIGEICRMDGGGEIELGH
jgi:hypothetical protein